MTDIPIASIEVQARTWRDDKNGNTYHSARVFVTAKNGDETVVYAPFAYGYGTQYLQSAHETLVEAGIMDDDPDERFYNLSTLCADHDIEFTVQAKSVGRRACENWGKE